MRITTRIHGWPFVTVREGGYALSFFDGEVPDELTTIWATKDSEPVLTEAVLSADHWLDQWAEGVTKYPGNPDSKPQPMPQVHDDNPGIAVWHKGRRVKSISDYYSVVNPLNGEVERYCHVEAISVMGEQLCATARLDEITYSAFRPITNV
jgi:hypothetical protein